MKKVGVLTGIFTCLLLLMSQPIWADVPTESDIQAQLKIAKAADQNDPNNKIVVQNLEETLTLLAKINQQKADIKALEEKIKQAPALSQKVQQQLDSLKQKNESAVDFSKVSLDELHSKLANSQQNLQQLQVTIGNLNAELNNFRVVPERAQSVLNANLTRSQEINRALSNPDTLTSNRQRLEAELELLELQNSYNKIAMQGNNDLVSLYTFQLEEKNLEQSKLQDNILKLQEAINDKYLKESQQQVEQLAKQQNGQVASNPVLAEQVGLNIKLSQELVQQTTIMNSLSQDNLRIQNVLDNLQQTQRNIDDQISALQGSFVLSRIINKQKNSLPQDQMISGLSKRITDLQVNIFDANEERDKLYDVAGYIQNLENKANVQLNTEEKSQLSNVLQERRKLLADMINTLNNQLNLAITIELNQKQATIISDQLQDKLQQQSFWVRSNAPMDMDWVANFVPAVKKELGELIDLIDFSNWRDDFIPISLLITLLVGLGFFIRAQKARIEKQLQDIVRKVNTLTSDSQWHTPRALLLLIIWSLPSALFFCATLVFAAYVCLKDPFSIMPWILRMTAYWWFFAFMLGMLHRNGIAYRHFNTPPESVDIFHKVLKRSVWISALWLNASIFTSLESGITNDVLGQVMTISVLIISLFILGPRFRHAVKSYENSAKQQETTSAQWLFNVARIFIIVAPIVLIALVVMGYYYTTLTLMDHFMSTYFVGVTWLVIRNVVYRGLTVSARRLSYNRLKEKQQQAQNQKTEHEDKLGMAIDLQQDEVLEIAQVKDQILRMTDLLLALLLCGMLYWVWKDLIAVAYYLEGVTLWKQSVVTETGIIMESVTLLNLLLAILILMATYALVRNIGGLLEILVFSRMSFSQGTPYTITTLATYFIIAVGTGFAFSTLGMSWSKLQWLFAALSVGLGFGLQAIFANFVSGIIILFERPVRVGDIVTIGGYSGTISKIRIRSTTLIDFDRKEVIIPNQSFVTGDLVNWALNDSITRVVIQVGVAYGSDLELTKQLLLQAAKDCELVLKDPEPTAYFLTFGASTLDHELRLYVGKIGDRNPAIDYINRRIDQLFAEHNIEIAFNQMDVYIKNVNTEQEIKVSGNTPQLAS